MKVRIASICALIAAGFCVLTASEGIGERRLTFRDLSGRFTTITDSASFDLSNPFFRSIGTNGRSCGTCHVASDAWSITPEHVQARFWGTNGQDPLFAGVDGSNCEESDVSTFAKAKQAYSLLLEKGLIRVKLPIPANAEFQLMSIDDPYHCAATPGSMSVYRRVLPATNLRFLSTVMWDGRENAPQRSIEDDLRSQIINATTGHAQASVPPTPENIEAILKFELSTYTAQSFSKEAGSLEHSGGRGGPDVLSKQNFFLGINDPLGGNPTGAPFNPEVFTQFRHFGQDVDWDENRHPEERRREQEKIRRGEAIFNKRAFVISQVAGLPFQSAVGTCTTCHDSPGAGDHSVAAPLNIGLTDASRRTPDLPLFTLFCPATGETIQTSDPGRALISGKCADIGKFKGPILRGLAGRAPYFHNGSAADLEDVVEFYDTRFNIGLSRADKEDLIAFLQSL